MEVDYKGFLKALGEHIRVLRKKRGWTNRDILVTLKMSDTQWRRYERGNGMTLESLLRLAACFDLSLIELLNGLGQFPHKSVEEILRKEDKAAIPQKSAKKEVSKPKAKDVPQRDKPARKR